MSLLNPILYPFVKTEPTCRNKRKYLSLTLHFAKRTRDSHCVEILLLFITFELGLQQGAKVRAWSWENSLQPSFRWSSKPCFQSCEDVFLKIIFFLCSLQQAELKSAKQTPAGGLFLPLACCPLTEWVHVSKFVWRVPHNHTRILIVSRHCSH